ncbi:MAG TPA: hypothetical protein VIK75_04500 [Calditerricola sp.]
MISEITVIWRRHGAPVGRIRDALERLLPPPVLKPYIVPLPVLGLAAAFNALNGAKRFSANPERWPCAAADFFCPGAWVGRNGRGRWCIG